MSRLPSLFRARRRNVDLAPMQEEPFEETRRDVFDLIPPRVETLDRPEGVTRFESVTGFQGITEPPAPAAAEPAVAETPPPPPPAAPPKPQGRNRHPVDMTDLSRLSIDTEGRLYWDGKPVEVRRRLSMSRSQVVGTYLIVLFVVVGGIGAAIQGSSAAYDWSCRLGLVRDYCPDAPALQTPRRTDIPA